MDEDDDCMTIEQEQRLKGAVFQSTLLKAFGYANNHPLNLVTVCKKFGIEITKNERILKERKTAIVRPAAIRLLKAASTTIEKAKDLLEELEYDDNVKLCDEKELSDTRSEMWKYQSSFTRLSEVVKMFADKHISYLVDMSKLPISSVEVFDRCIADLHAECTRIYEERIQKLTKLINQSDDLRGIFLGNCQKNGKSMNYWIIVYDGWFHKTCSSSYIDCLQGKISIVAFWNIYVTEHNRNLSIAKPD